MRIYREGLAFVLGQDNSVQVIGGAARVQELAPLLAVPDVDVVLFDLAVEGGLAALHQLRGYVKIKVVVLGLGDEEEPVLACARAGIAGYVSQEAGLVELTRRIREAADGEFRCSPRMAATLLRNLATVPPLTAGRAAGVNRLTPREAEIVHLIGRGLSNKEIARSLTIQVATVKNHVHNILEKLSVQHRADAVRAARSIETYPAQLARHRNAGRI
jgi:DNA-binding NarL/FixJ family response regulator